MVEKSKGHMIRYKMLGSTRPKKLEMETQSTLDNWLQRESSNIRERHSKLMEPVIAQLDHRVPRILHSHCSDEMIMDHNHVDWSFAIASYPICSTKTGPMKLQHPDFTSLLCDVCEDQVQMQQRNLKKKWSDVPLIKVA